MKRAQKHTILFVLGAVLLLGALGLLLVRAQAPKAQLYAQLLTEAERMNREYEPFTTDSVMLRVVRHYDHWWHPDSTRMKAYYLLGCAYRDLNNAPRALENYQRAAELADTTDSASLDRLMRVHSQMSELYMRQRLPEQMLAESRIAANLAWRIGDAHSALILGTKECIMYYNNKEYERCIKQALRLHDLFIQHGFEDDASLVYVHCINSYMELKDYPNVKKYLDLYEACPLFQYSPNKIRGGLGALYTHKGNYYLETGFADSSIYYFQKALQYRNNGRNELLATKGLFKTYALKHQADSVLKYTQLYSDAKEKDFYSDIAEATAQAKSLYDYSVEQKIAKRKSAEAEKLYKLLLASLAVAGIVVSCLAYSRKKKKQRIRELFHDYQAAIQERRETEEELTAMKAEQAADKNAIAEYGQKVLRQESRIATLEESIRKHDMRAKGISLTDSDIVKRFYALRRQGKDRLLTTDDWDALRKTIEAIYPTFHEHMNARQRLNENEYRVCLLVIAGFEPSDIAALLQTTNSNVSMIRKRLCIKVFGVEGKAGDFDNMVHKLY